MSRNRKIFEESSRQRQFPEEHEKDVKKIVCDIIVSIDGKAVRKRDNYPADISRRCQFSRNVTDTKKMTHIVVASATPFVLPRDLRI